MNVKTADDHLKSIFRKMCSYVDVSFDDIDATVPGWYMNESWDKDQEHDFMIWLTNYLYENQDAQMQLYGVTGMSLNRCRSASSRFCMMYGWTNKDL